MTNIITHCPPHLVIITHMLATAELVTHTYLFVYIRYITVRDAVKKTNSIFKDIVQIGGREVNPISKN